MATVTHYSSEVTDVLSVHRKTPKEPFTNDVSRKGEGEGYPNSDAVREVA